MNSIEVNDVSLFQFESFDSQIVGHAFFGRKGGVSPVPWSSLNQGGTVGDDRQNVIENRRRAFTSIGRSVESIYDVWQVHGKNVIQATHPRDLEAEHEKADAIITTNPEITLFMRFADCVPIMVYEPDKKIIGIIHAGWKGTVKKIVEETINFLKFKFAIKPERLISGIGPSIGPCHYQVGKDVARAVKVAFGNKSELLLEESDEKIYLDLWKANELQLKESGISSIEKAEICTACDTDNWFSHRAENGKTGRFGAAIFLK